MIRDFKTFKNDNIPLVGQAVEAFECVPIMTARCKCDPDNKPFIIRGVEMAMTCHRCHKVFGIVGIQFDRARNIPLAANIAVIGIGGVAEPQSPADKTEPEKVVN